MGCGNLAQTIVERCLDERKVAYYFGAEKIEYAKLFADASKVANYFKVGGFCSGDRIIIALYDSPVIPVVFLAALSRGLIPVVVNPRLREPTFYHIYTDCGAKAIFHESDNFSTVSRVVESGKNVDPAMIVQDVHCFCGSEDERSNIGSESLKHIIDMPGGDEFDYIDVPSDRAAFWQYTSGTTGHPKAVQHVSDTMLFNTEKYASELQGWGQNDIFYSVAKMFFGYGFGASFFFPLLLNASAVLDCQMPTNDIRVMQNVVKYRPTVLFANPAIYISLVNYADRMKGVFSTIQCVSAGMNLSSVVLKNWISAYDTPIFDGIGSTEMGHIFISNSRKGMKEGATGLPVPGYEVKIQNNSVYPLREGEVERGVLWVKGKHENLGYWQSPEKNKEKFVDGWCNTGDVFVKDRDGYYTCCGREDDLFKINGIWVEPQSIETSLIKAVCEIRECALVPEQVDGGSMQTTLYYVAKHPDQEYRQIEHDIRTALEYICEAHSYPKFIQRLDALPRNDNGKVSRKELEKKAVLRA